MNSYRTFLTGLKKSDWVVNVTKVYAGDMLTKLLLATVVIVLIRNLSLTEYTSFTSFNTILILFPSLVGSGINLALVQFSSERLSKTGKRYINLYLICFLFQFILYILFCLLVLVFRSAVTQFLFGNQNFNQPLIYGMLAGLGYLISMIGLSIYQAEEKFTDYLRINWLKQGTTFGLISILLMSGNLTFSNVALIFMAINSLVACLIAVHIFKEHDLRAILLMTNNSKHKKDIRHFFSASMWLIGYIFIQAALQRLDVFMLSHFSGAVELANYGVALQYYSLALLLLGSINAVLLPKFSKQSSHGKISQRLFVQKWLKATSWLIIPIMVFLIPSKPIFLWINGVQYESAFYIFLILAIGVWLSLMFSPLVNILIARKQLQYLFALAVLSFILNFIINYLFIPTYGGVAAAVAVVLSNIFINLLAFLKCWYDNSQVDSTYEQK